MSLIVPGVGALPVVASWDPEGDAPLEVPPAVRAEGVAGVQRVREARPVEACRFDFLLEAVSADLPPAVGGRPDLGVRAHALRPRRAAARAVARRIQPGPRTLDSSPQRS